jgi:hypothetical protein
VTVRRGTQKNPIKTGFFRTSLFTFRFRFPYDDNELNQTLRREGLESSIARGVPGFATGENQRENQKGGLWQKSE